MFVVMAVPVFRRVVMTAVFPVLVVMAAAAVLSMLMTAAAVFSVSMVMVSAGFVPRLYDPGICLNAADDGLQLGKQCVGIVSGNMQLPGGEDQHRLCPRQSVHFLLHFCRAVGAAEVFHSICLPGHTFASAFNIYI